MTSISFHIDGMTESSLDPFEAVGIEEISTPYGFEIACDLVRDQRPTPALIGARAALTIEPDGALARSVYGIIESYRIASPTAAGRPAVARFRLVPHLAQLRLTRQNHLFGTADRVSVVDVIQAQMRGRLHDGNRAGNNQPDLDYELRLQQHYPSLDHLAQYEETNLDFLARLTERYGIFWFFENRQSRERLVFADSNVSTPYIAGGGVIDWHLWSGSTAEYAPDTVQTFESACTQVSAEIVLRDWNYRAPNLDLLVRAPIDSTGVGAWTGMTERFLTRDEGEILARVRAEEHEAHKFRFEGRSHAAQLSAGHVFELRDHPYDEWNQRYLVISVSHTARVARPGMNLAGDQAMGYFNSFVAQPLHVPFRPPRRTPQPRLAGLMNGVIEGKEAGPQPMIDDQGRYKVRLPYDLSSSPDGKGSRWVRLATPFAGDGDGMHFPLHPGTEVVVAHVNGDPDRPLIIGTVANPATPNLVTGADPTQNRINFRAGMGFAATASYAAADTADASDDSGGTGGGGDSGAPASGDTTEDSQDHIDQDGNTMRLWVDEDPATTPEPGSPSPYQWLRLGTAASLNPGTTPATSVAEGPHAGDGFDLATGGIGRLYAQRDLFLIRNAEGSVDAEAENSINRLISIEEEELTLAHDGTILIGTEDGSGRPEDVKINANRDIEQNIGRHWSKFVQGNEKAVVMGATEDFRLGAEIAIGLGNETKISGGINLELTVGLAIDIKLLGVIEITKAFIFESTPASIEMKEMKTEIGTIGTEIKTINNEIKQINTEIKDINTEIGDIKTEIGNVKTSVGDVNTEVGNVKTAVGDVKTDVGSLQTNMKDAEILIGNIATALVDANLITAESVFL